MEGTFRVEQLQQTRDFVVIVFILFDESGSDELVQSVLEVGAFGGVCDCQPAGQL